MLNAMSPSIVRAQSSNDCQGHGPLEVPLLPQGPVCKADPISYVPLQSCFHKTVGVVCVKHESDWIILWLQTLQWGPTTYQGLGDTAGSGPICLSNILSIWAVGWRMMKQPDKQLLATIAMTLAHYSCRVCLGALSS